MQPPKPKKVPDAPEPLSTQYVRLARERRVLKERDCAKSGLHSQPDALETNLSGARAHRTENLAKEHDHDRDNTRAVRARQRAIGRELRRIYDGVVNEPIPEEFLALLKKIDDAGGGGQGSTGKTS